MSTVVVTGATGNIGGATVRALLDRGHHVRAVVRDPSAQLPAGVETVVGDLDEAQTIQPSLAGVDALFLLAGYRGEQDVLDAAVAAGVTAVVLLSGGGAAAKSLDNVISRFQATAEGRVRSSGLRWTILRPHAYYTNVFRWPAIPGGGTVRVPFAEVPVAAIDPADVGTVAAVTLTEDGHAGQAYELSGPEPLRPADQVRILRRVAGIDLSFESQPDEEARVEMTAQMPIEYVEAFFGFYADGNLDESAVLPTVETVTGRPPRTFAEWASANGERLRGQSDTSGTRP